MPTRDRFFQFLFISEAFILPSSWNISLLDMRFFFFSPPALLPLHCILAFIVSDEKVDVHYIGVPLYITSPFSLAAFKIFCLSLAFYVFNMVCLCCESLCIYLFGVNLAYWICRLKIFITFGKLLLIISLSIFCSFLTLISFWYSGT